MFDEQLRKIIAWYRHDPILEFELVVDVVSTYWLENDEPSVAPQRVQLTLDSRALATMHPDQKIY